MDPRTVGVSPGIRVGVNAVIVRAGCVLVVAFDDESGPHYNLPGGGLHLGESAHDGLRREVWEETAAEVAVGPLLLVSEYVPGQQQGRYGWYHKLGLIFAAELLPGSEPHLPDSPDPNETGVEWIPLEDLPTAPTILFGEQILQALRGPLPDPFTLP